MKMSFNKYTGQAICLAGALIIAQIAGAASFDCAKASTKVEHIICDNPEISKLDEELAQSYKAALQDKAKAEQIKQAQKQWLKERDNCSDAGCVKLAYERRRAMLDETAGTPSSITTGDEKFPQTPQTLRYAFCNREKPELYCEGQTGKGYSVCEAYLKYLHTLISPPTCKAPVPPGFSLPDWEEMDVTQHLDLAYQAEGLFLKKFGGYKHPAFDAWKEAFLQEIMDRKINPHMRKAKVTPNDKGDAIILAYTRDRDACHKIYGEEEQQDVKPGRRLGMPSNSYWSSQGNAGQLWASEEGDVHFVLFDDTPNTLQVIGGDASSVKTDLLIYSGRPYFVRILRGYLPLYKSHDEQTRARAGLLKGKSITWMDNSALVVYAFDPRFPDRVQLHLKLDRYFAVERRCQFIPH